MGANFSSFRTILSLLVGSLATACGNGNETQDAAAADYAEVVAADQEWDVWPTERRVTVLESELMKAMNDMRSTQYVDWVVAEARASSLLSQLRVELWGRDRDAFLAWEQELDALTSQTAM